jgi:hypothetical protein
VELIFILRTAFSAWQFNHSILLHNHGCFWTVGIDVQLNARRNPLMLQGRAEERSLLTDAEPTSYLQETWSLSPINDWVSRAENRSDRMVFEFSKGKHEQSNTPKLVSPFQGQSQRKKPTVPGITQSDV